MSFAPRLVGALLLSFGAPAAPDVDDHVALLLERLDAVEPGLVERLAATGEAAALDGLFEAYERLETLYLRRAVLRALPRFDRYEELGRRAATRLAMVATDTPSPVLREEALDALAQCAEHGAPTLQRLVEGNIDQLVREGAMERLVRAPRDEDRLWFLEQYTGPPPENGRKKSRRGKAPEQPQAQTLPRVRELAFGAVRSTLSELDLAAACLDRTNREIRIDALLELEARESEFTLEIARDYFGFASEEVENRVAAAGVLWRGLQAEIADEFLAMGSDNVTPLILRYALADYLTQLPDASIERKLMSLLKKGTEQQKLFALRALRLSTNKKVLRSLLGAVEDGAPVVAFGALEIITFRGETKAIDALREIVDEHDDAEVVSMVVSALAELLPRGDASAQELAALCRHPAPIVRSSAVGGLTRVAGDEALGELVRALSDEDWSVRLTALRGLEELRSPACIGPVVERLPAEDGRMLLEMTEFLWRLTGQPFAQSVPSWTRWWKQRSGELEVLPETELERLQRERFERRLKERSFTEGQLVLPPDEEGSFFGVRIDSNRVLFVIDVSGSMERTLNADYLGSKGLQRFEVAQREMRRCLDYLGGDSYFDIFAFSTHLKEWAGELTRRDATTVEDAKAFVDNLKMGGGTDIWHALDEALDIRDLDTIYILSDGEPDGGRVEDPVQIRMLFARRNANRGVRVHAIALGGDLPLLRWLADDTGGSYTRFR